MPSASKSVGKTVVEEAVIRRAAPLTLLYVAAIFGTIVGMCVLLQSSGVLHARHLKLW
jgi:hypothetical protein